MTPGENTQPVSDEASALIFSPKARLAVSHALILKGQSAVFSKSQARAPFPDLGVRTADNGGIRRAFFCVSSAVTQPYPCTPRAHTHVHAGAAKCAELAAALIWCVCALDALVQRTPRASLHVVDNEHVVDTRSSFVHCL